MKQLLTLLKTLYESDKAQALGLIQSAEGGVVAFLDGLLNDAKAGGIAGIVLNELKPAIEGGLEAYVQSHGPEVVYEWIDVMLTDAIAKA